MSIAILENIRKAFVADIDSVENLADIKKKYLGKDSELMKVLESIPTLSPEEKREIGKRANELKVYITAEIAEFEKKQGSSRDPDKHSKLDVTFPGKRKKLGQLHPTTIVMREMNQIFKQLGFSVYSGPEIETDEYVFEKLNLPKNHPARSLQDTIMIEDPEVILRSHTSSVEMRAMEKESLPLRIVVPGRVYRYENLNQSNHFAFYQYQGVAIGENITLSDLKGTLQSFAKSFFGPERKIRIRAKYYPEVEPGVGFDILCGFCKGNGCAVCKKRGWVELAGAGMVHPNALKSVNIDPKKYSGFAWGMGFDRIVMDRFGIQDIRKLFDGTLI